MKINRLDDLEVFVVAADMGSFSAAARQLGISPVVASAVIKRLENRLEVRLFERSTRHVRLSEAGGRFLPHARQALQALDWGASVLEDPEDQETLVGPLRLSLPNDLGRHHLIGWIDDFLAAQPEGHKPQVELRISDGLSDLIQQPVDFAIRYGILRDSSLVALPLDPLNRRVLCASPAYIARYGMPRTLEELKHHNCLRYFRQDSPYSRWMFDGTPEPSYFDAQGDRIADDGGVVHQWALAGLGVAYKSHLDVAADLKAGRLIPLMPELRGELTPLYFLVVGRHRLNNGIRRLVQYLAERCQDLMRGLV